MVQTGSVAGGLLFTHFASPLPAARLTPHNRTQQCFALKSGVDGFLDVARQTFCRVTEQARLAGSSSVGMCSGAAALPAGPPPPPGNPHSRAQIPLPC